MTFDVSNVATLKIRHSGRLETYHVARIFETIHFYGGVNPHYFSAPTPILFVSLAFELFFFFFAHIFLQTQRSYFVVTSFLEVLQLGWLGGRGGG